MNHQPEHQARLRHPSPSVPLPQHAHIAWQQRLSFIALTLGCLLLLNVALFASIAHAQLPPTPKPARSTPEATLAPTPTKTLAPTNTPALPPPPRTVSAQPHGLGLPSLAFGSLLLIGMVFMARIPVGKARRPDEHDG